MCLFDATRVELKAPKRVYKVLLVKEHMDMEEYNDPIGKPYVRKSQKYKYMYLSPFNDFVWYDNGVRDAGGDIDIIYTVLEQMDTIGKGFFHSFKDKDDASAYLYEFADTNYRILSASNYELAVCEFEIPDEANIVFEGTFNSKPSYASRYLRFVGVLDMVPLEYAISKRRGMY